MLHLPSCHSLRYRYWSAATTGSEKGDWYILPSHSLRYRYWSAATLLLVVSKRLTPLVTACATGTGRLQPQEAGDGARSPRWSQPALPVLVGCNRADQVWNLGVNGRHSLRYRYWSAATPTVFSGKKTAL